SMSQTKLGDPIIKYRTLRIMQPAHPAPVNLSRRFMTVPLGLNRSVLRSSRDDLDVGWPAKRCATGKRQKARECKRSLFTPVILSEFEGRRSEDESKDPDNDCSKNTASGHSHHAASSLVPVTAHTRSTLPVHPRDEDKWNGSGCSGNLTIKPAFRSRHH